VYWALHQYEDKNPKLAALYPALYEAYRELVAYRLAADDLEGLTARLAAVATDRVRRLDAAAYYDAMLATLPVGTLRRRSGDTLWKYPLLVDERERDMLLASLWEHGVREATRWYPTLRHMTAALCPDIVIQPTPNADRFAAQIINLPLHSGEVEQVCEVLSGWFT